jgi:hypothetical protein
MEHMIYELNLPQLSECIVDGVDKKYFPEGNKTHYTRLNPKEIFKTEYRSLKNLPWDTVLVFYRQPGQSCPAHSDVGNMESSAWGINWIYKGTGIMEYWDLEDFEKDKVQFYEDSLGYSTFRCIPTKPPRLKYILKPGAYLVNTTKIHRATSFQDRYCVSYRTEFLDIPWNEVINLFKDLIVDKNTNLTSI